VRKRTILLSAFGAILALVIGWQVAAFGLPGSNFEIDTNANLVNDAGNPLPDDWDTVNEARGVEQFTGSQDNSFGNGTKENTVNPSIVDGGIPPNKSDLKAFGLYQEGSTSSGFLNLFWSRVQDPSGTTNMDFELNQKQCTPGQTPVDPDCAGNGTTPLRTTGDILIIYDLSNGGTNATISFRKWTNNDTWSSLTPLTTLGQAVGTINTNPIAAADADGLGSLSARTFGEAQVSMQALFGSSTDCRSFGSAYLKSRSSDSFTAALKDFIAPVPVNITNCGQVNITKTDDASPANALGGAVFTLYKDNAPVGGSLGNEDTITTLKCTTAAADGKCTILTVPFGEYWVVETTTPSGYATAADQHATVNAANPTVSLSFVDVRDRGAIQVTKTRKHAASGSGNHAFQGVDFTVNGVTKTTDANGKACFDGLLPGTYSVHETTPTGYTGEADKNVTVNNAATCADSPYVGETVSFSNTPLTDLTVSVDSKVDGGTSSTITCGTGNTTTTNPAAPPAGTNGDGSLTRSNLEPGTYNCEIVIDP
jgi:hypothetical protein